MLGAGVALSPPEAPADGLGTTTGPTSGTATRIAWCTPSCDIQTSAQAIASEAMVMQFRLARARMRSRIDPCEDCLDSMQASYDKVIEPLAARFL